MKKLLLLIVFFGALNLSAQNSYMFDDEFYSIEAGFEMTPERALQEEGFDFDGEIYRPYKHLILKQGDRYFEVVILSTHKGKNPSKTLNFSQMDTREAELFILREEIERNLKVGPNKG